jgi:hypothetical protein
LLSKGLFRTSRAGAQGRIGQLLQYIFGVTTRGTPVRINGHKNFSAQEDEDNDTRLGVPRTKPLIIGVPSTFQGRVRCNQAAV